MKPLMSSFRYSLVGFLLFCAPSIVGQAVFRHSGPIQGLSLDETERMLVMDRDSGYHQLINKNLRPTDIIPTAHAKPEYSIWGGKLRQDLDEGFHLFESKASIYDVVTTDQGQQIVAADSGLMLFEEGQFRAFHIPGITFPRPLIKLATRGNKLAMLSRAGAMSVYDLSEQSLEAVASDVDHFIWDKWNTLWYAQGRALSFDVNHINKKAPMIEITSLQDGSGEHLVSPLSLEVGTDLTIDYSLRYSPMLNEPDLVYRLRDTDDWQKVPSTSSLKLSNLSAGNYEIQLRAEGLGDVTTFSEILKVKVASDVLYKLWPLIAGGLAALLALALISFLRLRNQLAQLTVEREKIKLNAELNEKTQKIGQLQMNPHFLFNTLNSISGLIALNENKKARQYLNQFSQMMRKMLDGSRKDFLTLAEEKAFLEQYLSLEAMCRNEAFSYEVNIDAELDTEQKIPAMILQPLVENAIIHGIAHKKDNDKEKGHITVHFQKSGKQIRATVQDNGIGRTAAQSFRSETESHNSAAMDIIQERLATLNKWNKSSVVYTDLVSDGGVAEGTRVEVLF